MKSLTLLLILSTQIPATECDLTLDADDDGLPDCVEVFLRTDPEVADSDADGIPDLIEVRAGVRRAQDPDTDNDGLCDGDADVVDVCVSGEDLNASGVQEPGESSAICRDPPADVPRDELTSVRGTTLAGCAASTGAPAIGLLGLLGLLKLRRRKAV